METASCLRFSILLLIVLFVLARSWYPLSKPGLLCFFKSSPWCTYKTRKIPPNLGSVQISKPNETPLHPLDPLTVQEINKVRAILSTYAPFSSSFPQIHSLSLHEPDKSRVVDWKMGDPFPPRKASVIAFLKGQTYLLTVDLDLGRVTNYVTNQGSGYPMLSIDDIAVALQVSNPEVNRSVMARGVNFSDLACITPSPGWFGPDEEKRRVVKVQCFSSQGTPNFYMRPIEGFTVTVDIDKREVVKILDTGRGIPIPKGTNTDYRFMAQEKPPKMEPIGPISMEQPRGPSFRIEDGHIVKWANWVFHLKPDQRAGLVISRAMVRDSESGELRSVMYKGFASELFVPYMDPDEGWYFKTYMDAGEFGLGVTAMSLVPYNDCPRNSHYMDGLFVSADGTPYIQPNMICVFERYAGDVGWRHSEIPVNGFEVNLVKEETMLGQSPKKSYLKAKRNVAKTEDDARIKLKLYDLSEFHVVNPSRRSRLGNPTGYKVVPGATAASLLDLQDPPQLRSAFTNNQIWVTPYNQSEQWAGGLLTYQSKGENTLAVWSERNRPIENNDIVLLYTMGFHHIPCQEDFPVMPTVSSTFDLKPVNFFESNPILRAMPNFEKDLPVCRPAYSY